VRGISAAFPAGCFHVLRGEAHSGKDALLRLLGLLEPPERGEVWLRGVPTRALDDPARTALRNRECGYVFAAPFLLAGFSVIENVAMPLFKISQVGPEAARRRTIAVLDFVGLAGAMEAPAAELPPAAQRSVALARALVNEPAVLLIEELETGADAAEFAALLRRACEHYGVAVIATASPAFSAHDDDRVIDLAGGRVRRDSEIVRQP
jgi:ABC-type lipoprotein export system ATPase subunit